MKRILHIAPLTALIDQNGSPGGAEKLCLDLAGAQADAGNTVSVICTTGSLINPRLRQIDVGIKPAEIKPINTGTALEAPQGPNKKQLEESLANQLSREAKVFERISDFLRDRLSDFDIIHNHAFDHYPLFEFNHLGAPLLHTLHCTPVLYWLNETFRKIIPALPPQVHYTTVSQHCAGLWQERAGFSPEVVYPGIDLNKYAFSPEVGKYYLWVGRIAEVKGLDLLLKTRIDKTPLKIAGRIYEQEYYDERIKPLLEKSNAEYLGYCNEEQVISLMRNALALINPIQGEEAFGIVQLEALACGTPLLSTPHGTACELIKEGENGFFFKTAAELELKLTQIDSLKREDCRASVAGRFSLETMTKHYSEIYEKLIDTVQKN